jgi:prepilin peptidase CpaA
MGLFHSSNWPLWFICAAMIASAVIDWWQFKVPNRLTFPVILSGWAFGLLHTFGFQMVPGDGSGGIGASLAGTALGFALLLPMYAIGGMGAGDVKMSMGFGAWAGAFFGLEGGTCLWVIFYAFCAGAISGGVIALVMIAVRGQFRQNLQHTRAILFDLATSGGIAAIAQKANERRPRWHRLPYGVPLCIGFVGYLWLAGSYLPAPQPVGQDGPIQQLTPFGEGAAYCLAFPAAERIGGLTGSCIEDRMEGKQAFLSESQDQGRLSLGAVKA